MRERVHMKVKVRGWGGRSGGECEGVREVMGEVVGQSGGGGRG